MINNNWNIDKSYSDSEQCDLNKKNYKLYKPV